MPVYDETRDDTVWEGRSGPAYGEGRSTSAGKGISRSSTWQDDVYDRSPTFNKPRRSSTINSQTRNDGLGQPRAADPEVTFDNMDSSRSHQFQRQFFNSTYSDDGPTTGNKPKGPSPGRPTAPKPVFSKPASRTPTIGPNQAVALFTFEGDQPGDLSFKKVRSPVRFVNLNALTLLCCREISLQSRNALNPKM